jgi:hypothetical protein
MGGTVGGEAITGMGFIVHLQRGCFIIVEGAV